MKKLVCTLAAVLLVSLFCASALAAIPVNANVAALIGEDGTVIVEPGEYTQFIDFGMPGLFAAQTPQVFSRPAFEKMMQYEKESSCVLTDECSAAVGCGIACRIVPGSAENLKITAAGDLPAAERIAARIQCGQ